MGQVLVVGLGHLKRVQEESEDDVYCLVPSPSRGYLCSSLTLRHVMHSPVMVSFLNEQVVSQFLGAV